MSEHVTCECGSRIWKSGTRGDRVVWEWWGLWPDRSPYCPHCGQAVGIDEAGNPTLGPTRDERERGQRWLAALDSAHRFVTKTKAQDILPASARLWRALEEDDYAAALIALTEAPCD